MQRKVRKYYIFTRAAELQKPSTDYSLAVVAQINDEEGNAERERGLPEDRLPGIGPLRLRLKTEQ